MTGTVNQFVIYDTEFQSGLQETLEQRNLELNAAINNTIRLVTADMIGEFNKEAFFKANESLIKRRDPTSTADAAPDRLEQAEVAGVKVNSMFLLENTLDSFKKIGMSLEAMSFYVGGAVAQNMSKDHLNTALLVLDTTAKALGEPTATPTSGVTYDLTKDAGATVKTANAIALNKMRIPLGDKGLGAIRALVMPSKAYYDLVGNQLADKLTGLSDVVVYGGTPATLGLPAYVVDSPVLIDLDPAGDGSLPAQYTILGLTEDAASIVQSESPSYVTQTVTGKQNLIARVQGEFSYNINVRGFAYTGVASPSDAVLGNKANWQYRMSSVKHAPAVKLVVN